MQRTLKKKIKKIVKRRFRDRVFEEGCEARFFEISGRGLKLYRKKEAAQFAYKNQAKAFNHGLAPEPFEKMNVKGVGYGFFTEIADLEIQDYWDDDGDERYELEERLEEIGIPQDDCHECNIGTIDGELVCIDFGPVSMRDY